MKLNIYQVDAFSSEPFSGNPAAVCILDTWFTPEIEVDLCGHATLATAHVLFNHLNHPSDRVEFDTLNSGRLFVEKSGKKLTLDFPADVIEEMVVPEVIVTALQTPPLKAYRGKTDFMFIYASQTEVESLDPDFGLLAQMGGRGIIVTSMGNEADFVSRFFAPQTGINEDPVTGSAHTTLMPYWSAVRNKKRLTAQQLSARGGNLVCELEGDRVKISGEAVTYLEGVISI